MASPFSSKSLPFAEDTLDGSAAAPDLAKVQSLYQSLLRSVHSREGQLSARQEQCGVLAREAGADALALGRASSRVAARLKVAEAAVAEYMQAVQDDETHRQLVSAESEKLGSIAKEVHGRTTPGGTAIFDPSVRKPTLTPTSCPQRSSIAIRRGPPATHCADRPTIIVQHLGARASCRGSTEIVAFWQNAIRSRVAQPWDLAR